jgi:soluble lytic murein transglycosylase-like protein
MLKIGYKTACGTGVLAALCLTIPARGAERITLANGFDLICNHHQFVDGRVRVFPMAEDADYFELKPEAIAGYETVPDPPIAKSSDASAERSPASTGVKKAETRLTAADLHQLLSKAGAEHNVDEDLLASVVKAESNGNVRATSRAGARGLMQLMPGTARELGVADSFAADENVQGGTAYLDWLLTRYHDNIALALAAYNAGPEAVDRYRGIPPYRETRLYVARVVHEFNRRVGARMNARRIAAAQISTREASGGDLATTAGMGNE